VVGSSVTFAALFGLAAQHPPGSLTHPATRIARRAEATSPTRFFDEQADGFAFEDASTPARQPAQTTSAPAPAAPSPPVAQTSVS
jgi:hypothetical protein